MERSRNRESMLAAVIRESGLSRRTVERVLEVAGTDELRDHIADRRDSVTPVWSRDIAGVVAAAPAAKAHLDHVSATPDTVLRRARWLGDQYDVDGTSLLFLGDHDLTSLATGIVNPGVRAAVVDVDEDLLGYIDSVARSRGLDVRCYYADLRFSLPRDVTEWADVVFTDPPYTPDGVGLFAANALRALRDNDGGNIVISYGFSERTPELGYKVQRELSNLGLVYEAVHPGFNAYDGAQAIGSRSDLYVCRPTRRSVQELRRRGHGGTTVYTRGPQSVESTSARLGEEGLHAAAAACSAEPVAGVVTDLGTLLDSGLPREWADGTVVIDLTGDPGPWLLRVLLAANAHRTAAVVPNNHPDVTSQRSQQALRDLLAGAYALRFRRSTPDSHHAVVEAVSPADPPEQLEDWLRWFVIQRAPGSLATAWREAVIRNARRTGSARLTKNEARARMAPHVPRFPSRLLDVPRHRLPALYTALTASAGEG